MEYEAGTTTMSQLRTRRSFLAASTAAAVGLMFKPAIAESQDLAGMTLQQARQLLRSKAVSPVDLTRACLTRIERYNGKLDAFITVTGEQALADARAMEAEQAKENGEGLCTGFPLR